MFARLLPCLDRPKIVYSLRCAQRAKAPAIYGGVLKLKYDLPHYNCKPCANRTQKTKKVFIQEKQEVIKFFKIQQK
jgi:hypothetical protein